MKVSRKSVLYLRVKATIYFDNGNWRHPFRLSNKNRLQATLFRWGPPKSRRSLRDEMER